MKKLIPTYAHGIFDYLGGLALLYAPNIFGFSEVGGAAVLIPRIIGAIVLVQSLFTNYDLGLFKMLPMKVHLMNDYIASIFLALSPWLFGFVDQPRNAWMPHLIVGITVLLLSLMTEKDPRRHEVSDLHRHHHA